MTLMVLPKTVNSTNYKLLPAGKFYTTRNKRVLGVVLHITAGLQDLGLVGDDDSAEGTIRWALSAKPEVSWHAGADSDGVTLCIPDWYTAWHAKGVNSPTVGLEISKLNVDWTVGKNGVTQKWVDATLRSAAKYLAAIVKKYDLPLVLQKSKSTVDAKIAANQKFGFVYHLTTSAGTRSDPGVNFPIDKLFSYIRAELAASTVVTPTPAPTPIQEDEDMKLIRAKAVGPEVFKTDGFRRQHIGKLQLAAFGKAGLKVVELANQVELEAYGPVETNPAGQK
jgi:hypothetical protein